MVVAGKRNLLLKALIETFPEAMLGVAVSRPDRCLAVVPDTAYACPQHPAGAPPAFGRKALPPAARFRYNPRSE